MTGHARTQRTGADASPVRDVVRRLPEKQVQSVHERDNVLAAGLVAHVGIADAGQPYVLPVAYAPWRDGVVFHGSTASRLFKALAAGAPTCFTVTLLDGLVAARSAFESSMEYRSAMLFGSCVRLAGADHDDSLRAITEHLLPQRWSQIRPPSPQENKATMVLYLQPETWSLKVGAGFAEDSEADLDEYAGVWAGRVPLRLVPGVPEADPHARGLPVPSYVAQWCR